MQDAKLAEHLDTLQKLGFLNFRAFTEAMIEAEAKAIQVSAETMTLFCRETADRTIQLTEENQRALSALMNGNGGGYFVSFEKLKEIIHEMSLHNFDYSQNALEFWEAQAKIFNDAMGINPQTGQKKLT